jgi:uncharacterized DUF497 family protein
MIPGFEWDPAKRAANLRKHGIGFVRAVQVFEGFVSQQLDDRRDYGEPRIIATGELGDAVLTVVYTSRGSSLRIISARRANAREARAYRAVQPPEAPRPD